MTDVPDTSEQKSAKRTVCLTGNGLTAETIVHVSDNDVLVEIDTEALERMSVTHRIVESYVNEGKPAYGVTTGLGARVVDPVAPDDVAGLSTRIVRGRANAVGEPLPTEIVRAAMLIRANGLARGDSGASPEVAETLAALLSGGLHPIVPGSGSIGASDIGLLSHIGLVLIGEGEVELDGEVLPAAEALRRARLTPIALRPRDGLAVISSNAVSAAWATFALVRGRAALELMQIAAALSMEGFRANTSPIDERVAAAHAAPGQEACAADLRRLLGRSDSTPRRLQDPISFRCVSQVHGSLLSALELLEAPLGSELNGSGDNPIVLADEGLVVSTGNFFVPAVALAADAVAIGIAQMASLAAARIARLLEPSVSGLPQNLAPTGSTGSGMAPLLKVSAALAARILHGAAPVSLAAQAGADQIEDVSTGAPLAAERLIELINQLRLLSATELLVAAQAVDCREDPTALGRGTALVYAEIRRVAAPLSEDRPLSPDIERVVAASDRIVAAARSIGSPASNSDGGGSAQ